MLIQETVFKSSKGGKGGEENGALSRLSVADISNAADFAVAHRAIAKEGAEGEGRHSKYTILAQTDANAKKGQMSLSIVDNKAALQGLTALDGEYILAISLAEGGSNGRKSTSGAGSNRAIGWSTAALGVVVAGANLLM